MARWGLSLRFGVGNMKFADICRERALALIAKDAKGPLDPVAQMWLKLAVVEDQLVLWAAQIEKDSHTD
jgi:hypothetical protein